MCFRRQYLPIQLAFLRFIVYRTFLSSLTFCNVSIFHMVGPSDFLHPLPAPNFKAFLVFLICMSYIGQIINCLMPTITDVIPILLTF